MKSKADNDGVRSSPSAVQPGGEALNQPPPLIPYNLLYSDPTLLKALRRENADWALPQIGELGDLLGREEAQRAACDANRNSPVLHTHDRSGNRRDEVEFHPAWHHLMRVSIANRIHSLPWIETRPGAHVARAAMLMLTAQNELGHTCPVSMTFSAVAALRADRDLSDSWEPKILSSVYDPRFRPVAEKSGAMLGMGMTEKQGGSDVRANTTRAERIGNSREYTVSGHKWFCSAPMSDAFLILAQAPRGLSCFLLPRWTPSGDKNRFHIQRLKDKMGNRSNASGEVEFEGCWAQLVGEEGRGVQTIIEMVNHTRLDCAIAASALMRQALVQALHHCRHRAAFGKLLIDQPLMRNVLADLAVESEAATLLMVRLAASFDRRASNAAERAFSRLATAVSKFWLGKRVPVHVGEALECLGGNGYVEDSGMPRLYREAPLYSIWEGSGNVICLDVLRSLAKEPAALDALREELKAASADRRLAQFVSGLDTLLLRQVKQAGGNGAGESEAQARRLAEKIAIALQGHLLIQHGSPELAEAFIQSRVSGDRGHVFGTLPNGLNITAILDAVFAVSPTGAQIPRGTL